MAPSIKLVSLAAAWPLFLTGQTSPDLGRILERLDRLEQQNRTLLSEVKALREEVAASRGVPADGAGAAEPPQATIAERVEIQQARIEELAQTKVEASQKFPVRLTGMALFNAFANSKQSGGVDYPVVAVPTGPAHDGATVRQSVLGLEFSDPSAVLGAKVHGSIYMDFFAGATNSAMRIRTASIGLDWNSRSVAAGLEKPIFNPREPSSLAQVGISPLTGAGNLWLWLPQVRVEQELRFSASDGLRAQVGAVQTREIGPYEGTVTPEAARPGAEGRFNFHHNFDEERRLEFATGFHTSTTHAVGKSIPSNLYSFDWFFNPWKRLEFTGVYYSGQNVAHLGSGTRQGYAIYGNYAKAVESKGGWGQLTIHAFPRLDFHLFTGQVDDNNHDLGSGSIGKNLLYGGNAYFRLAPNVLVGLEATQLRTMYIGQGVRINNHYDLALAYLF
ncbi:MAG TPA: hypothetical protein VMH28_31515 [Candidatus Acidoferrales bacterium]|nr:hypothetical protein [Candidatus Acidoferrales bacterium]